MKDSKQYTDIWIKKQKPMAIELKYKSSTIKTKIDKEIFDLSNHGAQDIGRYYFLKDVQRLEEIITKYPDAEGCAIIITNDSSYWSMPQKLKPVDAAFRIHEGQKITGELSWFPKTSKGTKKNREESIRIQGTYEINWKKYSNFPQKYGEFKILCLKIQSLCE